MQPHKKSNLQGGIPLIILYLEGLQILSVRLIGAGRRVK